MIKPSPSTIQNPWGVRPASVKQIQSLAIKTQLHELHGLPYPIAFRNLDVLKDWRKLFEANPVTWHTWNGYFSRPQTSVPQIVLGLQELLMGLRSANPAGFIWDWDALATEVAVDIAVNLAYQQRQGALIEATPALEVLLTQSDVDPNLPLSMVIPPYSAQYLRFGEHAAQALPLSVANADQKIDGVFCFSSPIVLNDGTTTGEHEFTLVFILKTKDAFSECMTLSSRRKDDQPTVSSWLEELLNEEPAFGHCVNTDYDIAIQAISYVAKVFLYMGLKEARQVAVNALSQPQAGQPKLGKRRQAFLYDRIVVGPESLPLWDAHDPSGLAVSPHWRRGHFRLQPHGPQASLRKVMFIMPTIVRADRLEGEAVQPKNYRAR